jgi:hypothetical protein
MVSSSRESFGPVFRLQWVVASALGWALAGALGWGAVTNLFEVSWLEARPAFFLALFGVLPVTWGFAVGAAGLAQWLVLRRHFYQAEIWVSASAVGGVAFWVVGMVQAILFFLALFLYAFGIWGLAFGAVPSFQDFQSTMIAALVVFVVGGVAIGAATAKAGRACGRAQGRFLDQHIPRADLWVSASALSFVVATLAVVAVLGVASVAMVKANGGMAQIQEDWQVIGWIGLVVGVVEALTEQSQLLRQQVSQAGWWVFASTLSGAVLGAVGGAVYGVVSGGTLVRLLRQPVPMVEDEGNSDSTLLSDTINDQSKSASEN